MKTRNNFTRLAFGLLLSSTFLLSSCDSDDEETPSNIVLFEESMLTADQEEEPVVSDAMGMFSGSYDKETNILTYSLSWTDITPTNMHFHKGELKKSGGVVVPIPGPYTNAITNAKTPALTEAQEADLLAGLWYVNIHSGAYPKGEIRGQVIPQ